MWNFLIEGCSCPGCCCAPADSALVTLSYDAVGGDEVPKQQKESAASAADGLLLAATGGSLSDIETTCSLRPGACQEDDASRGTSSTSSLLNGPASNLAKIGQVGDLCTPNGSSFLVLVQKPSASTPLGLIIDPNCNSRALLILGVQPQGPAKEWNDLRPRFTIERWQHIVEVNGVSGDSRRMLKQMKRESILKLLIRAPKEFTIVVEKTLELQRLGGRLETSERDEGLVIKENPRQGLIGYWNAQRPDVPVRKNHRIVEVNGVRGNTGKMLELIDQHDRLCLHLQ